MKDKNNLHHLRREYKKNFIDEKDIPKNSMDAFHNYFEFWQGRPNRLHDRIIYEKKENMWMKARLSP